MTTVVSLPTEEWADLFATIAGIDPVFWDFTSAPERTDIEFLTIGWPIKGLPWQYLAQLPKLRWVQVLSAGYDYAEPHIPAGVGLANGRGVHASATSELALSLILAANRFIPQFVLSQQQQIWQPAKLQAPGVADTKVLIVGYGDIGQALAKRLIACEATVAGVRTQAHPGDGIVEHIFAAAELLNIIGDYDTVVFLTPLSERTYHLADEKLIAAMRPGALLVNMARGGVVDTDALITALHAGKIRAALDVTEPEPLPEGHPLFSAPNCLIAPHMGGWTQIINPRMTSFLDDQLRRLAAGSELANIVFAPSK